MHVVGDTGGQEAAEQVDGQTEQQPQEQSLQGKACPSTHVGLDTVLLHFLPKFYSFLQFYSLFQQLKWQISDVNRTEKRDSQASERSKYLWKMSEKPRNPFLALQYCCERSASS